jgi:tetratricopeptide (TPR) repeat protein
VGDARLLQTRTLPVLLNYTKADERWLRAELLRAVGRDAEALRWYSSFPDPSGYDLIYLAPSHLRRAEILEVMGQREEAVRHYARFLELWKGADPEFRSLTGRARQRLQALGVAAAGT